LSRLSKLVDSFEKWLDGADRYLRKNKANIGYIALLILCGYVKGQSDFKFDDYICDSYSTKIEPIRRPRSRRDDTELTYYGSDSSVMTVMAYYDLAKQASFDSNRLSAARNIKNFFLSKKDDAYDPEFLQKMSIRALRAIMGMMNFESDKETCAGILAEVAKEEV
jgi:hypothetical protein